ncbi:hypothetical protein [Nocardioides daeguensis]|uniref:Sulfotransferase family protein n=1 Tax=Nocardioides daeguensis TaxID=908359 RepID=A0ABP6US76_9ACTN|nr:hypothetical protein [Nocardioides daeguensis]MBV6728610.1 hypothetical protein [Nocardioides daeguensis]MCR1773781.1 hypothetical protein [Nocardioides daeguensis]
MDSLPDGAKLLHIGMPKTGTTALQHSLWAARAALEEHGAHNVSRRAHERKVAITAAGDVRSYWAAEHERWQELAHEFRTSTARRTFWSSESLSLAQPDRIRGLREELGPSYVVCTLRALAPQLASRWQQGLRRAQPEPLEDWLRTTFAEEPLGGVGAGFVPGQPLRRLNPRRVLQDWGSVFGAENLVFVVLDPTDHSWLLRAFERLLGVPEMLELSASRNLSLPLPEAEMLRHCAAAYREHGGDLDAWMATAGDTRKIKLRSVVEAAPRSQTVRVPRWAAERANEYVADWVEALESSAARVLGDVRHLFSDPDAHPREVEVPEAVDVASAGRMMEAYFRVALKLPGQPSEAARPPALEDVSARSILEELRRRILRRS